MREQLHCKTILRYLFPLSSNQVTLNGIKSFTKVMFEDSFKKWRFMESFLKDGGVSVFVWDKGVTG